jgi:hypothetical protein
MRLLERFATYLDLLGVPTGRLCPGNLIADVSGHFVTADRLVEAGVTIPGRTWSIDDLRLAATDYIGLDLVSEVLAEEMHPGLSIEEYWRRRAGNLLEQAESNSEYFKRSIDEISKNILDAQRRLST